MLSTLGCVLTSFRKTGCYTNFRFHNKSKGYSRWVPQKWLLHECVISGFTTNLRDTHDVFRRNGCYTNVLFPVLQQIKSDTYREFRITGCYMGMCYFRFYNIRSSSSTPPLFFQFRKLYSELDSSGRFVKYIIQASKH